MFKQIPQDVINECLKNCWGVGYAEMHHQVLKMP